LLIGQEKQASEEEDIVMNGVHLKILVVPAVLVAFITSASAGEGLGKEATEKLVSGNTIEGKMLRWNSTYKMHLKKSGDWKRVDSKGNKESGTWRVDNNGDLCITGKKEKCWTIKKREGGYDMISPRGELMMTIDKMAEGNPHNL